MEISYFSGFIIASLLFFTVSFSAAPSSNIIERIFSSMFFGLLSWLGVVIMILGMMNKNR